MTLIHSNKSIMNEFQMKFIMRRSRKLRKQQFQSFRDRLKSKKLTSRFNSSSKDTGPKQIRHRESGKLFVLNFPMQHNFIYYT